MQQLENLTSGVREGEGEEKRPEDIPALLPPPAAGRQ